VTEQSESPVLSHRLQPREEVNGFNEQQRTLLVFCAPAAAESLAEVIDEAAGAAGCEAASLDRRAAVPMLELREALIFSLVEHLSAREWVTLALEDRLTFLRRGSGTCPQAMIELSVSEDAIVISISVKLQRVAPFDVCQVNRTSGYHAAPVFVREQKCPAQVKGLLNTEERRQSFERGCYVACNCNSDEFTQVRVLPDMRELCLMGVSKCRGDAVADATTAKFCRRESAEPTEPFVNSKASMQANWHGRVRSSLHT
jgi:hypothetical protein